MSTILVFGSSIPWGAWDEKGGWVQRLRTEIEKEGKERYVYNLGIDGADTSNLLERIVFETEHRKHTESGNSFLFSIGSNDTLFLTKPKEAR